MAVGPSRREEARPPVQVSGRCRVKRRVGRIARHARTRAGERQAGERTKRMRGGERRGYDTVIRLEIIQRECLRQQAVATTRLSGVTAGNMRVTEDKKAFVEEELSAARPQVQATQRTAVAADSAYNSDGRVIIIREAAGRARDRWRRLAAVRDERPRRR